MKVTAAMLMKLEPPRVVGLDLSINATGICDSDGNCTTVGGKAAFGDRRIKIIADAVIDAAAVRTRLVVIEGLAAGSHGGNGLQAAQVMGAVKYQLITEMVPYVLVPPSTLKKYATGRGNATKPDMAVALYKRAGLELADDNQVDAWWLRAAGLDALGHPLFQLPQAQRDALGVVTWPTPAKDPT